MFGSQKSHPENPQKSLRTQRLGLSEARDMVRRFGVAELPKCPHKPGWIRPPQRCVLNLYRPLLQIRMGDSSPLAKGRRIGASNERMALSALASGLQAMLGQFATALEEDEVLLQQSNLPQRRRAAVTLRMAERRILEASQAAAEQRLMELDPSNDPRPAAPAPAPAPATAAPPALPEAEAEPPAKAAAEILAEYFKSLEAGEGEGEGGNEGANNIAALVAAAAAAGQAPGGGTADAEDAAAEAKWGLDSID